MNKKIWKYPLNNINGETIEMPKGAEILTVQVQQEIPCIWALVNPEAEKENRFFQIFQTGESIFNEVKRKYIATFQLKSGSFVLHLFERFYK